MLLIKNYLCLPNQKALPHVTADKRIKLSLTASQAETVTVIPTAQLNKKVRNLPPHKSLAANSNTICSDFREKVSYA